MGDLVGIMPRGAAINSDLYLQALKILQKLFRSFVLDITAILLKSSFNTTKHSHIQVLKHRKLS